jgi:radical SAM superfamily enzyme
MVTLASAQHDRLLAAAARAGYVCLFLGLESLSPESLRLANKAFNIVDRYAEGIERIHRHGITVQAGIVGEATLTANSARWQGSAWR